jgi:WD40 repeat protein
MKLLIQLLILYQLVFNFSFADIVTTPIRSMPPNPVGHNGAIHSVAISPDDSYALSGSNDKTMKLWELSSGDEIHSFVGHSDSVNSVVISPDGLYILSGSGDKTMKLWNLSSGAEIRSFVGHTEKINSVAISPDGRYALSGSDDNTIKLWELSSGTEIRSFFEEYSRSVNSVAFSPNGRYILSALQSNMIHMKLWETSTGVEIQNFITHSMDRVKSVAISPDGRYVLSGSDKSMNLWDLSTGSERRTFVGNDGDVSSVAISPDGHYALSSAGSSMKLWKLSNSYEIGNFTGHKNYVNSVAISSNGNYGLSGSSDKTMKLWNLSNGDLIRTMGYPHDIYSIAISPDGHYALSGSNDNTIKLWNLSNGAEIGSFVGHTGSVISVVISPNGRYALSGSSDNSMILWDITSGYKIRNFVGHNNNVTSVAFSPDGHYALYSSSSTMKLYELSRGIEIRDFAGHTDNITSVTISPDGNYVLSGSRDKTMKLWNFSNGTEIRSFEGHSNWINSVAISPDGNYALSGSNDNTIKLWDVSSGAEIRSFEGHSNAVLSVVFSPDGRYALSGSEDNSMKLWNISSGSEIHSFEKHINSVTSVAFSPDGNYVYSGSTDRTLKMWNSGIKITPIVNKLKNIGQAIIIAAGGAQSSNKLYKLTNEYTQHFYRILKERGYKDEQIAYMNPQAPDLNDDGYLDKELLDYPLINPEQELTTAFQQAAENSGEQFIFYLHGHARPEHFRIKPDYELSADFLQSLLNKIPSTIPQILILDSCYSGSFFNKLKQRGRILISSADNQSLTWNNTEESFANTFLMTLHRGSNLHDAFDYTKQVIKKEKDLFGDQNPWLDDDGDGQFTKNDGILAAKTQLGNNAIHGGLPPTIQVHPPIELENVTEATLWVKTIPSFNGIKKVRAIIINPEFKLSEYKGLETDFGREELELTYNSDKNRYEIAYQDFKIPGKWSILYQALSTEILWSETVKGIVQVTDMSKAATIKMQLNQNSYKTKEPLQLELKINGQAQIDLYIALILPNGQFITFQDSSTSSLPNVAEIYKAKIEEETIPIKLPNGVTLGQYQVCGVLVKPNTEPLKQKNWIDINCHIFEVY